MKFNNRNTFISPQAKLGSNIRIGDNTVIYDNVVIGDNTTICNDCVLGEPLNSYYSDEAYQNPPTIIGANSLIRSHCIIYAGSEFGEYFSCGHRVTIREKMKIGHHFFCRHLNGLAGICYNRRLLPVSQQCAYRSSVCDWQLCFHLSLRCFHQRPTSTV